MHRGDRRRNAQARVLFGGECLVTHRPLIPCIIAEREPAEDVRFRFTQARGNQRRNDSVPSPSRSLADYRKVYAIDKPPHTRAYFPPAFFHQFNIATKTPTIALTGNAGQACSIAGITDGACSAAARTQEAAGRTLRIPWKTPFLTLLPAEYAPSTPRPAFKARHQKPAQNNQGAWTSDPKRRRKSKHAREPCLHSAQYPGEPAP